MPKLFIIDCLESSAPESAVLWVPSEFENRFELLKSGDCSEDGNLSDIRRKDDTCPGVP